MSGAAQAVANRLPGLMTFGWNGKVSGAQFVAASGFPCTVALLDSGTES
jgi:hypothetical protein